MNLHGYCVVTLLLAGLVAVQGRGKVTCFRKLKRNGKCAGIIRKGSFDTQEECCEKGAGFTFKKTKVGKNRFRCDPCDQNETFPKLSKRIKSKKSSKAKKEKKSKKPKRVKKILPAVVEPERKEPTTKKPEVKKPDPVVEVRPQESWNQPSRRTDISYSYADPEEEKVRWGPWSPCSVTCGAGWRSRFKECDGCDQNDYENVQSQPCMVNFYCPVDGNWGPWFPWQPCSASCGGGYRLRQRKCNYPPPAYGGFDCPGKGENNQTCNEKSCPVNGQWGTWTEFGQCSVTCGQGQKRKSRECNDPAPSNGGKNCVGSSTINKKCQPKKCPQNGGWSMWGSWSQCGVTCGKGTRMRMRSCDSPRPQHGGEDCHGDDTDSIECHGGRPCPVNGGWSEWENFQSCNAARCSKGYQVRKRSCTQPRPIHGGRYCEGDQYARIECSVGGCPVNGSWCEWSDWSQCTLTCRQDTALKVRQRECKCPPSSNGGAECEGEGITVKNCDELPPCISVSARFRPTITRKTYEEEIEEDEGASGMAGFGEDGEDEEKEEDYADHTEMEGE